MGYAYRYKNVSEMLGKTITKIDGAEKDSDEIVFTMSDGSSYKMYHEQDCCEHVSVEEVIGDVQDLIGNPLTMSEEVEGEHKEDEDNFESATWTFYKLATVKGYVTLRWLGTSNGYYSERVDFVQLSEANAN